MDIWKLILSMKNSNAGVDPSNPIFDSHYHDMSLCI